MPLPSSLRASGRHIPVSMSVWASAGRLDSAIRTPSKQILREGDSIGLPSERVFQRQLNDTRIARRRNQSEVRAIQRRDRVAEVDPVEHVERFGAKLDLPLVADPDRSREAHVDIEPARPYQAVVLQIAEGPRRWRQERRRVQPAI